MIHPKKLISQPNRVQLIAFLAYTALPMRIMFLFFSVVSCKWSNFHANSCRMLEILHLKMDHHGTFEAEWDLLRFVLSTEEN